MESFFAVLRPECFYLNKFSSVDSLQAELSHIHYYNHDRIKFKQKGPSPVQYRTRALVTWQTNRPTLRRQFTQARFLTTTDAN